VLSLPIEARWLYVSILLSADDVGLFEATEFKLHRKADIRREMIGSLLGLLVDRDLVRLYPGQGMRQFGFIPRFGQRLQIKRSKFPAPPEALYSDDEDAAKKFKDLVSKTTVDFRDPPLHNGNPPPEPEPEPEEEQKKKTGVPEKNDALGCAGAPKKASPADLALLVGDGVEPQVAKDWLKIRKVKRLPLTSTAWGAIKKEAAVAGLSPADAVRRAVEEGWAGFKASWRPGATRSGAGGASGHPSKQEALEARNAEVARRFLESMGGGHVE
jgi:hypothetical protein